jgi:fatty acid desaturase
MPIPGRLNLAIVAGVVAGAVALCWLGSQLEAWYAVLGVGVAFSYLGLTNYALLHEAVHGNLHSNSRVNYALGVLTGFIFPVPFSMIWTTHQGHHLRNRTDFEMFDLYYPDDNRFVKYMRWYGVLCGLFWPFIPMGAVVFALYPRLLRWRTLLEKDRVSRHLLGDIRQNEVRAMRGELLLLIGFWAALFSLLELHWLSVLVLYGCFSINWSTRQYVGHAFSQRDVIEGAWNLRTSRFLSLVLLHGEYDLNHHRRPDVPWYYLPSLPPSDSPRPSYFKQYWRQWRGPRLVIEPAPESLRELPLSVHGLQS